MPEDTPQPTFPQTTVQLTQESLIISVNLAPGLSITAGIGAETVSQICQQWVLNHEELRNELIAQSIQVKRGQLELIQSIKRSRND
jgi:hypothetical protein